MASAMMRQHPAVTVFPCAGSEYRDHGTRPGGGTSRASGSGREWPEKEAARRSGRAVAKCILCVRSQGVGATLQSADWTAAGVIVRCNSLVAKN